MDDAQQQPIKKNTRLLVKCRRCGTLRRPSRITTDNMCPSCALAALHRRFDAAIAPVLQRERRRGWSS